MGFDQAQSPRLGQRTSVESTFVQIFDADPDTPTEDLIEAAWPGQLVFRNDLGILQIYNGEQNAWQDVAGGVAGHLTFVGTDPPTGGSYSVGDTWYDSDDQMAQYVWDGTGWVPVDPNLPANWDHIPADNITGGSLVNPVTINAALRTPNSASGGYVQILPAGVYIVGPGGNTTLTPDLSEFKGQAEMTNVIIKGNPTDALGGLSMRSQGNEVARSGKLILNNSVSPPSVPPGYILDWYSVPLTGQSFTSLDQLNLTWDASSSRWWVMVQDWSGANPIAKCLKFTAAGAYDGTLGGTKSGGAGEFLSGVRAGTSSYWLWKLNTSYNIYKVNDDLTWTTYAHLPQSTAATAIALAHDGTNLLVAENYSKAGVPTIGISKFATAATAGSNLVYNPTFDPAIPPLDGWTISGPGTMSRNTSSPIAGTASIQGTASPSDDSFLQSTHLFAVTAKKQYTFSCQVKGTGTLKNSNLYVAWYNGSTFISQSAVSFVTHTTVDTITGTATAPANATQAGIQMLVPMGTGSYIFDSIDCHTSNGLNYLSLDERTMTSASTIPLYGFYAGAGDFGTSQYVFASTALTNSALVCPAGPGGEDTSKAFPLANTPFGLGYDGTSFWTLGGGTTPSLYKYEGGSHNTSVLNWTAALTYKDTTAGYETTTSGYTAFTMKKRARLTITAAPLNTTGTGDPNAIGVYLYSSSTLTPPVISALHSQGNITGTGSSMTFGGTASLVNFSGAAPNVVPFGTATPAELRSQATMAGGYPTIDLFGDGHGRIGQMTWDTAGNISGISSGSGAPADTYTAACSSNLDLTTTAVTDIPGMSVSITVADPTDRFLVVAAVDFSELSWTSGNTLGTAQLNLDGTAQTGQVTFNAGGTVSNRSTCHQNWVLTGMSAGSHTVKMTASMNNTNSSIRVIATHTRMTIVKLTAIKGDTGPAGPPAPTLSSEYSFASAATSWVINHNLGTKLVEVSAFDSSGLVEYDPEIEYTSVNTVTLKWYFATSGIARVVG